MDLNCGNIQQFKREFLAVLLAGFGNELLPLTSDHGDEPCPKALLPISNKPMIDYVLSWIEQSGIKDVLLICPTAHRPTIYHHIHSDSSVSPSSLRIDVQAYDGDPSDSDDEQGAIGPGGTVAGTCALLRHFSNRITGDFVILPCDFIPPSTFSLSTLLNKFRAESTANRSVLTTCWFAAHSSKPADKGGVPEEWGPSYPRMVPIVWDPSTGTLLHVETLDDEDRNGDEIELHMSLLSRYPRTKLSSRFQDSHVYVCRRLVLDLLREKRRFDSFREEFLPWLCKVQYQHRKAKRYPQILSSLSSNASPLELALEHSTTMSKPSSKPLRKPNHIKSPPDFSVPPSPTDENARSASYSSSMTEFKVGLIICGEGEEEASAGLAIRVNTLPNFLEINRKLLSQTTYSLPTDPKNRSLIDSKAQISSDTVIGDSTQVSERTTIKKSVIGRHCVIGKMIKIVGCVLLDHCVVEDSVKLDGCILGSYTKVGTKAEITRCVTRNGYEVDPGDVVKGEKLDMTDWTAAPDDCDESDDSGGDDGGGDDDGDEVEEKAESDSSE